jgi:hypothetical protein
MPPTNATTHEPLPRDLLTTPTTSTVRCHLLLHSELLHQVLPHGPHARPLPENVHGNRKHQTAQLDAAKSKENLLRAVGFEPAIEEEREDEPVENVWLM